MMAFIVEGGVPTKVIRRDVHRRGHVVSLGAKDIPPGIGVIVTETDRILSAQREDVGPDMPFFISAVTFEDFCNALALLHEELSGNAVSKSEIVANCFNDSAFELLSKQQLRELLHTNREQDVIHNPYGQELREQEAIRNGDREALRKSLAEVYEGRVGEMSPDPVRQMKNLDIVVIALACRSAIAGGLLPEVAFSMSDAFIQRVEALTNIGEIAAMGRHAEMQFCDAVHALKRRDETNPLIQKCRGLVSQRLHTRIEVRALAEELGVAPDYLSRLFSQTVGIPLTEYIAREKVEASKEQLKYTRESYQRIAYTYGFSSQSHFGRVFAKYAGMTPGEYRQKYAV